MDKQLLGSDTRTQLYHVARVMRTCFQNTVNVLRIRIVCEVLHTKKERSYK
jgi:hypothetical protein